MTLEQLHDNMRQITVLKAEIKARSQHFDVDAKERLAQFYGLPLNEFYGLPFDAWIRLKRSFSVFIDAQSDAIRDVESFHGLPEHSLAQTPFSQWFDLYISYERSQIDYCPQHDSSCDCEASS